ncbi:glycosyltransferase involved in cell wall biosynthesis [Mycobacterium sp. BK558]|nr:glycosyltransferase involved in cell wall biosynthesis [Mycobacterium sp. BK558]
MIGPGTHFISGVSHYTHALACALSTRYPTAVVLMRRLIPRRMYPGAERVGTPIANHRYPDHVRVFDGVDWFWFPSILRALKVIWIERPDVVVLQWWTGAVAHTYLTLVALARLRGARVVLEMHEMQDTGEAAIPFAKVYTHRLLQLLTVFVDGFVAHSEADRAPLAAIQPASDKPVQVIRHGPFTQYSQTGVPPLRDAPIDVVNIMFFGTIRPYKGLEVLIQAFDALSEPEKFWLTVVGETWEGWTLPGELIAASPNVDRITFVNRYVTECEAAQWLAGADALVLPHHRSSASGPLHVGMALGLPIAVTEIPALVDAAAGYQGCVFFPPRDVGALREALYVLAARRGMRYEDPTSWAETVEHYEQLLTQLPRPGGHPGRSQP